MTNTERIAELERKVKTLTGATLAALTELKAVIVYLRLQDGNTAALAELAELVQPVDPIQPPDDG